MLIDRLVQAGVATPPRWMPANTHYLTMMGSVAYGVSGDTSDVDVYGFCMPPKEMVFPHMQGVISGFGSAPETFQQYQQHHMPLDKAEYDVVVYSIVKYFHLLMENNPNIIDSLFTPQRCILHMTEVARLVRDNRRLFLHKGCYPKFKGYAYSQIMKIKAKKQSENAKRAASMEEHGYDVKAAYHVVRLALECEQILEEGNLDLERNRAQLKAIRRGEWTFEHLEQWFSDKEIHLENVHAASKLPAVPDEAAIRDLLMKCLELHYGKLEQAAVVRQTDMARVLAEMQAVIDRHQT
jgi:predicted nucleotidyltransferase